MRVLCALKETFVKSTKDTERIAFFQNRQSIKDNLIDSRHYLSWL